jgi:tRNA-2-methylthio-N6-dimethylallyladenosine synthase
VPSTRGREVSRPLDELVREARRVVADGVREITLLGQNVNAWTGEDDKGRKVGLEGLMRELAAIPDLARIRYTTSHPNDMTQGLIDAHGEIAKLMPFLHLPVQAGNNRSHTVQSYLEVIERVRTVRPDIALSGDFIVGFPGETDAEFEDTLKVVDAARYAQCFSFKYSPRPGTPAATMDGQVPMTVMDERLQRLQAALNRDQHAFNAASVGRICEVLVERHGKFPGQWLGKSPWLQSVHFEGEARIGEIVTVELTAAGGNSLSAIPLARRAA